MRSPMIKKKKAPFVMELFVSNFKFMEGVVWKRVAAFMFLKKLAAEEVR